MKRNVGLLFGKDRYWPYIVDNLNLEEKSQILPFLDVFLPAWVFSKRVTNKTPQVSNKFGGRKNRESHFNNIPMVTLPLLLYPRIQWIFVPNSTNLKLMDTSQNFSCQFKPNIYKLCPATHCQIFPWLVPTCLFMKLLIYPKYPLYVWCWHIRMFLYALFNATAFVDVYFIFCNVANTFQWSCFNLV